MLIDNATDRRAEKGGNQKCTGENPEHDCPGQAEPRSYGVGKVVVAALGTAQTLAWGSSYYLPAIRLDRSP
jgi:hypothetical protein